MHYFPKTSGTANAVIGSSQFIFGAIVGLILSQLHDGTALPMFSMMFVCSVLGYLSFTMRAKED
jgi:DHA1 family bicyclomycin/chloramphenicol resistance-like MFS transporter